MMDRRDFIKSAAAISLASTFAPSIGYAADNTPKRGGHLIIGNDNASATDRLDPAFWFEAWMYGFGSQLFNTLVEVNEKGEIAPALATEWNSDSSSKTWVIKLRSGVTFHDGRSLTAEDVVYSLNHHRPKDSTSPVKSYLSTVSDIKASGPLEVTITLTAPNVDFISLLSELHFAITPKNEDFNKGIGTGAFILEHFQPGVRGVVKRNPNHWNPNRGFVDSVETLGMNDPTARVAALVSGSAQIINNVAYRLVSRLKSNSRLKLVSTNDSVIFTLPGLSDVAPFNNPNALLALKYAIDREAIIKTVLGGFGKVAYDNPIFPSDPYFSADLPRHTYDPEKAARLWRDSGYTQALTLSAADSGFRGSVDAAQLYQSSAKKAGIQINVEHVPDDGYWTNTWMKKPFVASNWAKRPTADALLSMVYEGNSPWNESRWKNDKFDQLLTAARAEKNDAKRKQIYHDLQEILVTQGSFVLPLYSDSIDATSARLSGFSVVPGLPMSGYRVAEKVWFT